MGVLLLEDGSGGYLLEDGSSLLLEDSSPLSLTAGAILLRVAARSSAVDAVLAQGHFLFDLPADSILRRASSGSLAADASFAYRGFAADAVITDPRIRVSQAVAEVLVYPSDTTVRASQVVVEVLVRNPITFPAAAVLLRERSVSRSANAAIRVPRSESISADAIFFNGVRVEQSFAAEAFLTALRLKSVAAEAVIRMTNAGSMTFSATIMPVIRAGAVLLRAYQKSGSINAYITGPLRVTHDRATPPHYDNDLDTVIVLAKALGVYAEGMDLHSVLAAVTERISDLEAGL